MSSADERTPPGQFPSDADLRRLPLTYWRDPVTPPPEVIERMAAIVASWSGEGLHVGGDDVARVARLEAPPYWWPWVRSLELYYWDELTPGPWLSGITRVEAIGVQDDEELRTRGFALTPALLDALVSLRELTMTHNPQAFELEAAHLPASLVSLDLSHAEVGRSIEPVVRGHPSIERLILTGTGIESLQGIDSLPRLRELDLSGYVRLDSLEALRGLRLRSLALQDWWEPWSLDPLASLRELETLDLYVHYRPVDLTTIARLPRLRRLALGGSEIVSLAAIRGSSAPLAEVHLRDTWKLETLDGLEAVTPLEVLSVTDFRCPISLRPLGALPRLREVHLERVGLVSDLDVLAGCPELQALTLVEQNLPPALRSVEALASLAGLRSLRLGLPEVRALPALGALHSLESLELDCPALTSLDALRDLPDLRTLALANARSLRDVTALRDLPSLARLDLRGDAPACGLDAVSAPAGCDVSTVWLARAARPGGPVGA